MQVHHNEGSVRVRVVLLLVCVQRSEVGGKFIYHSKLTSLSEANFRSYPYLLTMHSNERAGTQTNNIHSRDHEAGDPTTRLGDAATAITNTYCLYII